MRSPIAEHLALPVHLSTLGANQSSFGELIRNHHGRLPKDGEAIGVLRSLSDLKSDRFDPAKVDPLIHRFYERSNRFKMEATVQWITPFVGAVYSTFAHFFGQLDPGPGSVVFEPLFTELAECNLGPASAHGARIWRRTMTAEKRPFYTSVVRPYLRDGASYLHVMIPYGWGNFSVVFELQNTDDGGMCINANPDDESTAPDCGNWATTVVAGFALPAARVPGAEGEKTALTVQKLGTTSYIEAKQEGFGFDQRVFQIDYRITEH